jgi:hypothetical protein
MKLLEKILGTVLICWYFLGGADIFAWQPNNSGVPEKSQKPQCFQDGSIDSV